MNVIILFDGGEGFGDECTGIPLSVVFLDAENSAGSVA
jgi:hypothetical protein